MNGVRSWLGEQWFSCSPSFWQSIQRGSHCGIIPVAFWGRYLFVRRFHGLTCGFWYKPVTYLNQWSTLVSYAKRSSVSGGFYHINTFLYSMWLSRLTQSITNRTNDGHVAGSNPSQDNVSIGKAFSWFSSFPPGKYWNNTENKPRPLHSTYFPVIPLNHRSVRRYIVWERDNFLKQDTNKQAT
jgi:hypothetical protein